ncbi:hypothetical protein F5Y15DRAFT_416253 [Xylariaceae sp. FL0016]|nr:hypothetical protein F5Y15DRAFT_416253 [Xylariaceae sp. FL0016]
MANPPPKTIAFLGASGGCGLAALTASLAAGYRCIALCRTPAKLTGRFPEAEVPNLAVVSGNAHDAAAVARCLVVPGDGGREWVVDAVCFTIGSVFRFARLATDDPHVCEAGMRALLEALAAVRKRGDVGAAAAAVKIVAVSTNGISRAGWDFPLVMVPFYRFILRVPHEDKKKMEQMLVESGEQYTVVRPSILVDGASQKPIRVGIEDWERGREKEEIGYTISREDTGRWIFENLLRDSRPEYGGKMLSITW